MNVQPPMPAIQTLPDFISPMLAQQGQPFDSDEHLFEIKWDGIRATAYIDRDAYRLVSRRAIDITERYPEFDFLAGLPAGTILDGEIVVLNEAGKPEFRRVLSREQARSPIRFRTLSQATPANFVIFDQLYHDYEPLLRKPLSERRKRLIETGSVVEQPRLVVSDGVIGPGIAFFQQVVARDIEGIVAKRLNSHYFPGKRTDAWIKFRKSSTIMCAILGFVPKGDDFESLILGADDAGELRYVGRVGTGFDEPLRTRLNQLLRQQPRKRPLVPCKVKGQWIEPGLFCSVRYLEWSYNHELREPVFEELITNPE